MPLDRCGAQVASRQSPILHNGAFSLPMLGAQGKSKEATIQMFILLRRALKRNQQQVTSTS